VGASDGIGGFGRDLEVEGNGEHHLGGALVGISRSITIVSGEDGELTPTCAPVWHPMTRNEVTASLCRRSAGGRTGSFAHHASVIANKIANTTPRPNKIGINGCVQGILTPPISTGKRNERIMAAINPAPRKSIRSKWPISFPELQGSLE
jgi:hypothetical protein